MRFLAVLASLIFMACPPYSFAHNLCTPCDFDGDGSFTVADHETFLSSYGKKRGQPGYNEKVDFDRSGSVTTADFGIFIQFCF